MALVITTQCVQSHHVTRQSIATFVRQLAMTLLFANLEVYSALIVQYLAMRLSNAAR